VAALRDAAGAREEQSSVGKREVSIRTGTAAVSVTNDKAAFHFSRLGNEEPPGNENVVGRTI